MPSLRDIRGRIRSIQNTKKITKAYQVVAATKLRRAQQAVQTARPYADKMLEVLATTSELATEYKHPFLQRREGKRAVVVLVTTDKGLCGAINVNALRAANRYLLDNQLTGRWVTIGKKGRDFLSRFGRDIVADASELGDYPSFAAILPAITVALQEYEKGEADTVLLVYEKWISTLRQEPTVRTLLPIEIPKQAEAPSGTGGARPSTTADYIYEPGAEEVLDALLPRYVETQVFQAVLENKASEWSARMIAMQNATDAAGELIDSLTLFMNKVRQAMITTELMEIVSGAEALRSSGS
ncbi:MAG TPA: ATP synthase F1 subunit gamma [Candidatus Dormibacteraeota bacterium]